MIATEIKIYNTMTTSELDNNKNNNNNYLKIDDSSIPQKR
jgi:hypothetical protein